MKQAVNLWLDGIKYRQEHFDFPIKDEYIFHTQGIAFASRQIASRMSGMNPETAYICGLLHDYGKKYNEREIGRFHGLVGFQELNAMGLGLPARICLTHTFVDKNINFCDFPSYPKRIWTSANLCFLLWNMMITTVLCSLPTGFLKALR